MFCFRCKLIFEKKKKKKKTRLQAHTRPTNLSFLSSCITPDCDSKEALMKFTWEPYFGYGLHIPKTCPHHIRSRLQRSLENQFTRGVGALLVKPQSTRLLPINELKGITGHSFPPIQFGGILLQPTTWQANRPFTCVF